MINYRAAYDITVNIYVHLLNKYLSKFHFLFKNVVHILLLEKLQIEDVEFIAQQCGRHSLLFEHAIFQEKLHKMLREKYTTDVNLHRDTIDRIIPAASVLADIYDHVREKGRDLAHSYDKSPYTHRKTQKAMRQHKNANKTSITQRLWTDLGRSVGVTIATKLV